VRRRNGLNSIYVFGLFQVSSGKTVVSKALCRGLTNMGLKVAPFKPRSGHNIWYQRYAFEECRREGRLFCEDIIKLKKAARCSLPYEVLNPVDALMAPMYAGAFLTDSYMRGLYLMDADTFNHLLVERYTMLEDGEVRSMIFVNAKNLTGRVLSDKDYIFKLTGKADKVSSIEDVARWASVFNRLGHCSISTCRKSLEEEYGVVVVEGFNDAVCPELGVRYKAVIGVGPGVAAFYDPEDFYRVIELKSIMGLDPKGLRSKEILEFVKPEEVVSIPALSSIDLRSLDVLSQRLGEVVGATLNRLE